VGLLGGALASLLFASGAYAQCSKDTDCKGDRVCDSGSCVTPPLPAPPPAPNGAAPADPTPSTAAAAPPPPAPPVATYTGPAPVQDMRPKTQRHSTGMMAGGIVMVSFAPIAMFAVLIANMEKTSCEGGYFTSVDGSTTTHGVDCGRFDATIYGGLLSGAVLLGVGIPLIMIGGKKEPVGTARIAPWATPQGAGLGLRIAL